MKGFYYEIINYGAKTLEQLIWWEFPVPPKTPLLTDKSYAAEPIMTLNFKINVATCQGKNINAGLLLLIFFVP